MKTPPLLLGAALLFWGFETGFLLPGLLMAVLVEAPRWLKARWEFSNEDYTRIWVFCTLLCLGAAVYAFTSNEGPAGFQNLFRNPNLATERNAGTATTRTAAALLRWVPMLFFLFIGAQAYGTREGIPLETLSLILALRWRRARKRGLPVPPSHTVNISYPYFAVCLMAASANSNEDPKFYWILCALLGWALWPYRSRRFRLAVWGASLLIALGLGLVTQHEVGRLQAYLGTLNPQWLSNFARRRFDPAQTATRLGTLGRIKPSAKIVIRLAQKQGAVPTLLREASYRLFDRRTWSSEFLESDFTERRAGPEDTTYQLVPDKTDKAAVNIACYLPGGKGLLPLPEDVGRLEHLQALDLWTSPLGAVLEQGPGFVMFDARYGPGATLDSPPHPEKDVQVPAREIRALDQALTEMQLSSTNLDETLQVINRFFLSKFSYATWFEPEQRTRPRESPLARFLLRTRAGHCEYFATAGVLLLRQLGIPARYAVGYAVHESDGEGKYVVRQRDAHAWCLVWDNSSGSWRDFDPTPATWLPAEAKNNSPFQGLWDFWSRIRFELSKFRWGQSPWRQYVLWLLVPVLGFLLVRIIFRLRRRHSRDSVAAELAETWPGLDSEFYELAARLASEGAPRAPGEPLTLWLPRALSAPQLSVLKTPLEQLLHLHYRYRFDPRGLTAAERETLRAETRRCVEMLETRNAGLSD